MNIDKAHEIGGFERIYLLVTIVERGLGDKVITEMRHLGATFNMATVGYSAVGLDLVDYFGLSEHSTDLVFSVVTESKRKIALSMAEYKFSLDTPEKGLAFIVPISGVGGPVSLKYISGLEPEEHEKQAEVKNMKMNDYNEAEYRCIITIVNRGYADQVIDAARDAGARGGTILYARGTGIHETETFMNISITPEKEMVFILVKRELAKTITHAILVSAGLKTKGRGISFILPVTDAVGMVTQIKEGDHLPTDDEIDAAGV
jgi:nitrogen regulatory protein PII